jgi:hypothetical protein
VRIVPADDFCVFAEEWRSDLADIRQREGLAKGKGVHRECDISLKVIINCCVNGLK